MCLWCGSRQTRRVVINSRNEYEANVRRKEVMTLDQKSRTPKAFLARSVRNHSRRLTKIIVAIATALVLGGLALVLSFYAHAAPAPAVSPLWGSLDTLTGHAATEGKAGVTMGMLELNWGSFEPSRGTLSSSYLATMKYELAS